MVDMLYRAANLLILLLCLALGIEVVDGYHGGRRSGGASSRSFVAIGGWSFGATNDISTNAQAQQGVADELLVDEVRLLSSGSSAAWRKRVSSSRSSLPSSELEEEEDNRAILAAAIKTRRRLSPFLCKVKTKKKTRLRQQQQSAETDTLTAEETEKDGIDQASLLVGAAETLIPKEVWEKLTGDEYDDPTVVERLAQAGLLMATKHNNNGWVEWKGSIPGNLETLLDDGDIEVFTGSTLRSGYGSEVPWIKSISKLPFSPSEMAELMMDSSRVKTYNSLSVGRQDVKLLSSTGAPEQQQSTKIVRNVVQLPVSNSKVESVTLLHTRELNNGAHLLVSRALGVGSKYYDEKIGTGYTLLGVNLFEPIPNNPDECRMTAISHVYSPGVPLMIAGKVGVKSAKNFVKDIRALCVPAAAS